MERWTHHPVVAMGIAARSNSCSGFPYSWGFGCTFTLIIFLQHNLEWWPFIVDHHSLLLSSRRCFYLPRVNMMGTGPAHGCKVVFVAAFTTLVTMYYSTSFTLPAMTGGNFLVTASVDFLKCAISPLLFAVISVCLAMDLSWCWGVINITRGINEP